jgi:hypothetical protein
MLQKPQIARMHSSARAENRRTTPPAFTKKRWSSGLRRPALILTIMQKGT